MKYVKVKKQGERLKYIKSLTAEYRRAMHCDETQKKEALQMMANRIDDEKIAQQTGLSLDWVVSMQELIKKIAEEESRLKSQAIIESISMRY